MAIKMTLGCLLGDLRKRISESAPALNCLDVADVLWSYEHLAYDRTR